MVDVAQLVRALVCGSRGRGFESHLPPKVKGLASQDLFLFLKTAMKFTSMSREKKQKKPLPNDFNFEGTSHEDIRDQ